MGKIKKKMDNFDEKLLHARADVPYLFTTPDSPLKCDNCKAHLGMWRMVRRAVFKKKGSEYYVVCRRCHTVNRRVKGELAKELDKRWEDIDKNE